MYTEEYGYKIKFSKFCDLRPKSVLPLASMPMESCCCLQHENMMQLLDPLSARVQELRAYDDKWVTGFMLCPTVTESCTALTCKNCSSGELFRPETATFDREEEVSYFWWVQEGNAVEKVLKSGPLEE